MSDISNQTFQTLEEATVQIRYSTATVSTEGIEIIEGCEPIADVRGKWTLCVFSCQLVGSKKKKSVCLHLVQQSGEWKIAAIIITHSGFILIEEFLLKQHLQISCDSRNYIGSI